MLSIRTCPQCRYTLETGVQCVICEQRRLITSLEEINEYLDACNKRMEDREAYRARMEAKYCDDKAGE